MSAAGWAGRASLGRPSLLKYIAVPAVVGLVATWAVYAAVSRPATKAPPTAAALVAAREIPAKTILSAGDLRVAEVPVTVAAGAATDAAAAVGRITVAPLGAGQIVYPDDLAQPGNSAALSYHIPAGMRAESVRVNDVTGITGMVQPGDHVDIIAMLSKDVAGTDQARLLLQNVLILAAGSSQQATGQATSAAYSDVTVALYPADAVLLAYAASRGSLQLLLDPAVPGGGVPAIIVGDQAFGH
ncbi:MAG TPA: Flp pilus assembly protein CpaB [Bacillota bacterium]|nr:Flp pilus assembly protein CpaB [Bacillota bacterium]